MKNDSTQNAFCENEHAVVTALLSGALSDDLLAHVAGCPVCKEVLLVSHSLSQEEAPEDLRLPDASLVWRRAQTLARQEAIAKAAQPIRIARICAYVAAIFALPWLAFWSLNSPPWMPSLSRYFLTINRSVSDALTGTPLLGIIASLVFITVSSWYVLRQE